MTPGSRHRLRPPTRAASDGVRELRSIAPPSPFFVSPAGLRRAIAGYAAAEALAPTVAAGAVREGVALALVIASLAHQVSDAGGTLPWMRSVPTTYDTLQELTGLDRGGLRSALETLAAAGVLRRGEDGGGLTLTLADEQVWAPHAVMTAVPWSLLSLALSQVGAPVRAGLVVFAELAIETEAVWRTQDPLGASWDAGSPAPLAGATAAPTPWLELTLKGLAHRVGYHHSHVDNALAGLEAAGCLTRLRGASGGAFRIAPWTIGAAEPPATLLQPVSPASSVTTLAPTSVPTGQPASAPSSGDGIEVTLNGMRLTLAPSARIDMTARDASGRRVIRVTDGGLSVELPERPASERP